MDLLSLVFTGFQEPRERSMVFMFTGQGAQYVQMGRDLYETEATFRHHVDRCCQLLETELGFDLRSVIYPDPDQEAEAAERLGQTAITQPALFVIEYALAQLWMDWGIKPAVMIGHSIGEYVAACVAGVFSLEDALKLVATRGKLMQALPGGAMLSVPIAEENVTPYLSDKIALATVNAPGSCVLSGETEHIDALEEQLSAEGIGCRRLHTSHAFHSHMMDPILEPFQDAFASVTLNAPQIPYVSNVTGRWIEAEEATDPAYWAKHLRQAVRFADGIEELVKDPDRVLLEVGPGTTLVSFTRWHPQRVPGQTVLSSIRHPNHEIADMAYLLTTLGRLWLAGMSIEWSGYYADEERRRIPLPTYPFERRRYWVEPQSGGLNGLASPGSLNKRANIAE
ncbi:acyltransferase domain-containing protein [Chloroflexi bacterium TSY]|nr:acyltransferase domain-containing protein [Chloroflexi bacterium TSY]